MGDFLPAILALAGGLFPALAWLWFWRQEDRAHPEPRRLIILAFIAGMLTVVAVIPVQKFVAQFLIGSTLIFTAWSVLEELFKFIAARITVLGRYENDEPIDSVLYMVTVALGFAALENALFLLSPLSGANIVESVMTGNLRFVGATLLHVLSSALIGVMLALSFYKSKTAKWIYGLVGVILAAVLHSGFNFLILNTREENLLQTFAIVWVGVIAVLALLEFIKRMKRRGQIRYR